MIGHVHLAKVQANLVQEHVYFVYSRRGCTSSLHFIGCLSMSEPIIMINQYPSPGRRHTQCRGLQQSWGIDLWLGEGGCVEVQPSHWETLKYGSTVLQMLITRLWPIPRWPSDNDRWWSSRVSLYRKISSKTKLIDHDQSDLHRHLHPPNPGLATGRYVHRNFIKTPNFDVGIIDEYCASVRVTRAPQSSTAVDRCWFLVPTERGRISVVVGLHFNCGTAKSQNAII